MTKKIALLLTVLMLVSVSFTACSSGSGSSGNTPPAQSTPANQTPASSGGAQSAVTDASSLPVFDAFPRPKMAKDGKSLNVAYLYGQLDQDDDIRLYHQMDIEVYNRGWELHNIDVSAGEEAVRSGWLTAINLGVDLIILPGMSDLENKMDLIEQSRQAGIGIYATDSMGLAGVITNFNTAMGVAAMELFYRVASDMQWSGNFCISTAYTYTSVWERTLPVYAYLVNDAIFQDLHLLEEQAVDFTSPLSPPEQCYQFMQTWNQKYGRQMDAVFIGADADAVVMNESAVAAGRTPNDILLFTIGGSPSVISGMRESTNCVAYNYAMSPEFAMHNMCELAYQLQVLGLTPGDGRCLIDSAGGTTNLPGAIITRDNLPDSGESIHSIFAYYDPTKTDEWYFWTSPSYEVMTWN